jgi:hypothetical protein
MGPFIIRRSKMSIKSNLKATARNLMDSSSAILEVSSEVSAEVTSLAVPAMRQIVPTGKALALSLFSMYEGYLVRTGVEEEEARAKAYAVLDKDAATVVTDGSKWLGAAAAALKEGWDEELPTK